MKTNVEYKPGYIYYVKNDNGFIGVYAAEMVRGKKKKKGKK